MIDNPDGTRRLPTKEEILENVRRSIRTNNNSSQTTIRTDQGTTTEDRRFFDAGRGASFNAEGRNRIDESQSGSRSSIDDRESGTAGSNGVGYSSVNEYSERIATSTAGQQFKPVTQVKSKFKPYADAMRLALKSKEKSTDRTKPVSHKVLTKQEVDSLRQKLIESLLWQSDHIDEFIVGTTKGHIPIIIWSDLDIKDATIIANFMLERAKSDKQMAYIVREMVSIKDKIQLALIVLPRVYRTLMVYLERGISIR